MSIISLRANCSVHGENGGGEAGWGNNRGVERYEVDIREAQRAVCFESGAGPIVQLADTRDPVSRWRVIGEGAETHL